MGNISYRLKVIKRGKTTYFYQYNKLHKKDGPAIFFPDEYEEWWYNGLRHRIKGPSVFRTNGIKEYWFNGIKMTPEDVIVTFKRDILQLSISISIFLLLLV